MTKPEFPFLGPQTIISSDRVTLHSKKDGVFLFGKSTVGLSSVGTVNLDSNEQVLIDAPKITLGHQADILGNQAVLGNQLLGSLNTLLDSLNTLGDALAKVDGTTPISTKISLTMLKVVGDNLKQVVTIIKTTINDTDPDVGILSNTTYTR